MYLTGSVLFLSLVLHRFFSLIGELVKNDERSEVLRGQAAKTSNEYMKMIDKEREYMDEIQELKEKLEDIKKSNIDKEIVLKQARQTNDEYMKLTDKYVALEKKFEGRTGDNRNKSD